MRTREFVFGSSGTDTNRTRDGDAARQGARALQRQVDAARGLAAVGDRLHDQVGAAHAVAGRVHAGCRGREAAVDGHRISQAQVEIEL
jgi:hypothetical protein